MKLTEQQKAYINFVVKGEGHTALKARAGSGKTSTILAACEALVKARAGVEICVLAYNKAIADEISGKLKARKFDWKACQAQTMHAMGFNLVKFAFRPKVDAKKVQYLIKASNIPICGEHGQQVEKLVAMAKQSGVGFFDDMPIGNPAVWYQIADHYNINSFDDTTKMDAVVEAAQTIYRRSLEQTDVIDFDDMILFPLVKNMAVKFTKSDIFLDEAQDASRARQALARKFLTPKTGRLHIVGDDRQAIYGFSGADSAALENLIADMGATVFPLTTTWRCPKTVVAKAQQYVPDIQAAESAIEGEVQSLTIGDDEALDKWLTSLGPDDAILCRNTAPLITLAYTLIRQRKACKVEGRAIGEGLAALAKRWKVTTIDALLNKLDVYLEREIQKAQAKGNDAKADQVDDQVSTLREICQACISQGKKDVSDVIAFIDELFADGATGVTILATYHRSKGREFPRVTLWEHALRCPSKMAKLPWQKEQEQNLAYVAVTRAMETLIYAG